MAHTMPIRRMSKATLAVLMNKRAWRRGVSHAGRSSLGKALPSAQAEDDAGAAWRLLLIGAAQDGLSREAASGIADMGRQTLRACLSPYHCGCLAVLSGHWDDSRSDGVTQDALAWYIDAGPTP